MHARDLWQVRSIKEGRCGAIVTNRDNRTGRSSVTAANKQSKKVAGTAMLQAAKEAAGLKKSVDTSRERRNRVIL